MGSSVVTRSSRALGAEKFPITRVVPSLVSISVPNKGVGHLGTTRNWWENICPSQQQRSAWVNLLVIVFLAAPKNGTSLGRDILAKLGTTLVMESFSAPRALQLLVTTEEPITPSPIGCGETMGRQNEAPGVGPGDSWTSPPS